MKVDLAVVGGGPAGAACALAAAELGLTVALFEPRVGVGDKPCGEGIMPEGVAVLRRLGLDALVDDGAAFSAIRFFIADRKALDVPLRAPGRAYRRPDLQAAVDARILACSAIRVIRSRAQPRAAGDGFLVVSDAPPLAAGALVLADGLSGGTRAQEGEGREDAGPLARLGVRARFRAGVEPTTAVQVHMGRGSEVYLTPIGDGIVTAAVLARGMSAPGKRAAEIFADVLAEHPSASRHLGEMITPCEARVVGTRTRCALAGGRWFRAGDAGIAVDPIVGCGVTLALESGMLAARAAQAVVGGVDPRRAARDYEAEYRRLATPRSDLARFLRFLSAHDRTARAAAFVLGRSPKLLAGLVAMAG